MAKPGTIRPPAWQIDILSRRELNQLLRACSRRAPSGLRDRALIGLLFGAGLRIAEALALETKDLDLDAGAITVHRGKGARRRVAALDEGACALVREWVACRDRLRPSRPAPLFCQITRGRIGLPLAQAHVRQMLRRRAGKAGLEKRVHPHAFRHSHAAELAGDGLPLHVIQAQLGHASLATTSRYLAHLHPAEVLAAVRSRPSARG